MTELREMLAERREQEDRLAKAGFDVDGGGIGGDGEYDIFVYAPESPEVATILHSKGDVDKFIASDGTRGGDHWTVRQFYGTKAAEDVTHG